MNCNEEFVVKAIGKLSLEYNFDWEQQRRIREILYACLCGYEITSLETGLVKSDIDDKIMYYLQAKKLEGYSEKTLKNYFGVLLKFSSFVNKPVAMVTKNDIRLFLMQHTSSLKQSSMNTLMYTIKGFFTWLHDEELIPSSPAKNLPVNKLPKRLRKSLTIEELERLRKACTNDRERALIEFLFATGCRLSEVVEVNISDLNLNDNTLRVIGKGNKERIVCFSDKTKFHLNSYLLTRKGEDPALFVSERYPYGRIHQRGIQKIVKGIADKAGFDKSVYPHLLRHTMATLGFQSGANLTTIQHLLGHTSPVVTQTYAEESIENVKHEYGQHFIQ